MSKTTPARERFPSVEIRAANSPGDNASVQFVTQPALL
jgi:hypothetical protein